MGAYTTLIQPEGLAALIRELPEDVIICDCSFDLADPAAGLRAYQAGHIPGAVWLHLEDVLSGPKTGLNGRHPLPSRDALATFMASLGASANSQIVAYDAAGAMFAARLWWLMRWLGHGQAAVLDGGLAAWRQAGYEVETAMPRARPRGTLTAGMPLTKTIDYTTLRAATPENRPVIFDARAPDRFRGENETLDLTGGHIPGALNHSFRENLTADGRFKPASALRAAYMDLLGGNAPEDAVSSCGSGVTACHNLLAMEIAGLPNAALYPGSWSEWSAQPDAPIARGTP